MSGFADSIVLGLMNDATLRTFLSTSPGASALFNLVYKADSVDLQQIQLAGIRDRHFAVPAFETTRTRGTDERIVPSTERIKIDREHPRGGRLAWVDVYATIELEAKVADKAMPVDRITVHNLLAKIGGAESIAELKTKLSALYAPSIVDAFFERFRIAAIADFAREPALFLEFVIKEPPPFNSADPNAVRRLTIDVCIQIQSEVKIIEALQGAKLCRSILENEHDGVDEVNGFQVLSPFAFVVIFPDAAVVDDALPGMTAAQIKAATRDLFLAEHVLAHFA